MNTFFWFYQNLDFCEYVVLKILAPQFLWFDELKKLTMYFLEYEICPKIQLNFWKNNQSKKFNWILNQDPSCVGQIGNKGNGNLGKANGALAASTIKCRERMFRRFSDYLILRSSNCFSFYSMDEYKQSLMLGDFFCCLRKQESYKKKEQRVCASKKKSFFFCEIESVFTSPQTKEQKRKELFFSPNFSNLTMAKRKTKKSSIFSIGL